MPDPLGAGEDVILDALGAAGGHDPTGAIDTAEGFLRSAVGRHLHFDLSSSAIASVDWDPESMEMTVVFAREGRSYVYSGVPESVVRGFGSAASAGEYFHANVRGRY